MNNIPVAATFSKDSSFFGKNFPIHHITESSGAMIRGNDGKWYLDWISGLGANLLGYYDREVNHGFYHHVSKKIQRGIAYSMPHELEYTVADKLVKLLRTYIPFWRDEDLQVRWTLSGSDACNAAIRLAKTIVPGKVYSFGYHGMADRFIASTPPARGLDNIEAVVNLAWGNYPPDDEQVSAVIIEIPPTMNLEDIAYVHNLGDWCTRQRCLLIIDEVVTGLRYARGGACELYNLEPDMICMGKALGNGMPIGALISYTDCMDYFNPIVLENHDPVFISSTNVGNLGSLAAADYVLDYIKDGKYLNHTDLLGSALQEGLQVAGFDVIGNFARNLIVWENDAHKAFSIRKFADNGILLNRPNFVNMAHTTEHMEKTIHVAKQIMNEWLNLNSTDMEYWQEHAPITMFRNR